MFFAMTSAPAPPPRPAVTSMVVNVVPPTRQIVTDAGAGGYQAFPDVCRLKDGELLCVFYAGYGHVSQPNDKLPKGGRICSVRSHDEGKTWSEPAIVADTPKDDRDPSVYCAPNGTVLCTFFSYGRFDECDTMITRSHDAGKSWSDPEVLLPGYATSTAIRRLRSGRLLLPVYTVDGAGGRRHYAAVCLSDNGGATWSTPHAIGLEAGKEVDETDVFERKDGTIIAISRAGMYQSESHDGGLTWSPIQQMGFPGHCPCLLMTRQGVLLLAHRIPKTSLHFSTDEGRTWHGPVLIDDFIGAYPSLVQLKDGSVLCVYYEEGPHSAIRAAVIRIATLP